MNLKMKWLAENLRPEDRFILLNVAHKVSKGDGSEKIVFDGGRVTSQVNQCAENQILLEVKTDPDTKERTLHVVDSSLSLLGEALRMTPEGIQKILDKVFLLRR